MKKHVLMVLILAASAASGFAQGFDWQPSPRRPYKAPRNFIGLELGIGRGSHTGSLPYLEVDVPNACCTYESGTSLPMRIALVGESWIAPTRALGFDLSLQLQSVSFAAAQQELPRVGRGPLVTRYELDVKTSYLAIGASVRQRLGSSMVVASAGVRSAFLLSASMTNREVVIGPAEDTFADGQRVLTLPTEGLADAASVFIEPNVSIGYDLPLSVGTYIEPSVNFGYSLSTLSSSHSWKYFWFGLGVRLMKGR
ncbi:MAG: hypothetical protein FGM33_01675 [Candidatus Kapabacteria bacterium]|nr:hypothetical protein [Candidatus Kapabacteria bacterium]